MLDAAEMLRKSAT